MKQKMEVLKEGHNVRTVPTLIHVRLWKLVNIELDETKKAISSVLIILANRRRSNCVKEVEKLKKNREERR